jgi:hypothetical protein
MYQVSLNIIKFSLTFKLSRKFFTTAKGNFPYLAYNNVPQGFAPQISNKSSRVFIAVPRRYPGVPSTLNYIKLEEGQDSYVNPKLRSFPNYEMNELDVSMKRFRVPPTNKKLNVASRLFVTTVSMNTKILSTLSLISR